MVLGVPKLLQKDENACLPTCIKMVLDFYIQTDRASDLEEMTVEKIRKKAQVKKIDNTHYNMMKLADCDVLNTYLKRFNLSIFWGGDKKPRDITQLINDDIPPILVYNVPIYLKGIGYDVGVRDQKHSLVVKGFNMENSQILVNDPDETLDSLGEFRLSPLFEAWKYVGSKLLWIGQLQKPLTQKKWESFYGGEKKL